MSNDWSFAASALCDAREQRSTHPKTKKAASRVFTFDEKTRVFRDGKAVKLAEVSAQKNEKVAVVVDHDVAGDIAVEVRFGAAK